MSVITDIFNARKSHSMSRMCCFDTSDPIMLNIETRREKFGLP